MNSEYEIYERRRDGVVSWRGLSQGLEAARVTVQLLSAETGSECFAVQSATRQRTFIRIPEPGGPRAFQIAYGSQTHARAEMLHRRGYDVTSALGNTAARLILSARLNYDVFVIGHETAEPVRSEMIAWLRDHHGDSTVLPLKACDAPELGALPGLEHAACQVHRYIRGFPNQSRTLS